MAADLETGEVIEGTEVAKAALEELTVPVAAIEAGAAALPINVLGNAVDLEPRRSNVP